MGVEAGTWPTESVVIMLRQLFRAVWDQGMTAAWSREVEMKWADLEDTGFRSLQLSCPSSLHSIPQQLRETCVTLSDDLEVT